MSRDVFEMGTDLSDGCLVAPLTAVASQTRNSDMRTSSRG